MTPWIARTSVNARQGVPVNRRRRLAHRGPRFAWKQRRRTLIAEARERVRDGFYDRDPVLRIAVDRLIDRLMADIAAR